MGSSRFWLKAANEESKCIPHEFPRSHSLKTTGHCVKERYLSNVFSSETAWPIKAKFYVDPPWERGTKVYINDPGYMTKMAARPIYGKNL